MRLVKRILLCLLIILIVIQFFQPSRNKSNEVLSTDLPKTFMVPDSVYDVMKMACYDCHSNNTNYPWYSRVQPFGWLLNKHIKDGKKEINFSDFGSYSFRRKISKLNGIANSVKEETMPLSSYKLLHSEARLTSKEKALLIEWATKLKDSLSVNN